MASTSGNSSGEPPPLQLRVVPGPYDEAHDTLRVTCRGELDLATVPDLLMFADDRLAAGHCRLELECSELAFCDARGLAALLEIRRKAEAAHGGLVLVNPSAPVRRTLHLAGLERALDSTGDVIPFQRSGRAAK